MIFRGLHICKRHELVPCPLFPHTIIIHIRQNHIQTILLYDLLRCTLIPHQMLHTLYHRLLNPIIQQRTMKRSPGTTPKLRQTKPSGTIMMRKVIFSRGINIPPTRPRAHRQCHLFPHKTPRHERIKRHVNQKLPPRKKESRGNERDLCRAGFVATVRRSRVYPYNGVRIFLFRHAHAQSRAVAFHDGVVYFRLGEARGVRTEDEFGVALGGFVLHNEFLVPVRREL
mmetsp:Transcript_18267/g.22678  ORF Transcript_18267/g.22678 Transcript_18267/m.22678 type:complete len:227 (-) Transcript_18267:1166-1846(-)